MSDKGKGIVAGLLFVAAGVGLVLIDYFILSHDVSYFIGIPWIPFSGIVLVLAGLGFLYVNISRKYDAGP